MLSKRNTKKIAKIFPLILLILLVGNLFVWNEAFGRIDYEVRIDYLDVGQGDATLISTKDNVQILIDTGPSKNILKEISNILSPLDRSIDAVIITHPDKDHVEGLLYLMDYYQIGMVIMNKVNSDSPLYFEVIAKLESKEIPTYDIRESTDLTFGTAKIDVIWPRSEPPNLQLETELNETSISLMFSYNDFEALITGDLYKESEIKLLGNLANYSNVEIYKAGHHGSKTSTSSELLSAINPNVTVISSGKSNSYGHPAEATLKTLKEFDQIVYRTDLDGSITVKYLNSFYKIYTNGMLKNEYEIVR